MRRVAVTIEVPFPREEVYDFLADMATHELLGIELVSTERPARIIGQTLGPGGHRVATGTYTLRALPFGWTRIVFEHARRGTLTERISAPLVRALLRRRNERAMQSLAERLGAFKLAEAESQLRASETPETSTDEMAGLAPLEPRRQAALPPSAGHRERAGTGHKTTPRHPHCVRSDGDHQTRGGCQPDRGVVPVASTLAASGTQAAR